MTSDDFVSALKLVAAEGAAKGTLATLLNPPGRRPHKRLLELSAWLNSLDDAGRRNVQTVTEMAANQAVYNVLLVLDGLLAVDPDRRDGDLQLLYAGDASTRRLNDPDAEPLSALFKAEQA